MNDPVYKYIKGKGWVPSTKRPFPWDDLAEICNTCGHKAGTHGVKGPRSNAIYICPFGGNEESEWS